MTAEIKIFPGKSVRKEKPPEPTIKAYVCPNCELDRFWVFDNGAVQCAHCFRVMRSVRCELK